MKKLIKEKIVPKIMWRRTILLLILTIGCISQVYTEEDAIRDALDFIRNAPTISFDGMEKTLQTTGVELSDCETYFIVSLEFVCMFAGFGNRTSMFLLGRPTEHTVVVHVQRGKIIHAIIDDEWDELNQTSVA